MYETLKAEGATLETMCGRGPFRIVGSSEELLKIVEEIEEALEAGILIRAIVFKIVPTRFPSGVEVPETSYTVSGHSFAQDPQREAVVRNLKFALTQWSGRETALKVNIS